jgi:DNA repair exonuclease SbcCD nuclease subunit
MFSARKPATVMIPLLDVAIHGQSYATADVRANLAEGYPGAVPGSFNIGLLHTCGPGTLGHAPYAPCSLPQFAGKGYQYWALGHVHTRQDLIDDPPVIFPGNIQGRHIGETGPHGCLLVQVDERHRIVREFVPLDVLRWYVCNVDATGAVDAEAVIDRFGLKLNALLAENPGTSLAIRVVVSGATDAHRRLTAERRAIREKIQGVAIDLSNGSVWVEKLLLDTRPQVAPSIPEGPVAEVKAYLEQLRANPREFESLRGEIAALREFLPADLLADCGFEERDTLLGDVEALLMDRLLRTEAAG